MGIAPKYGIGDRVFVPTTVVQGLIVGMSGRLNEEFTYTLRYTDFQTGAPVDFTYRESEVVRSNPVEETPQHLKSEIVALQSKVVAVQHANLRLSRDLAKVATKKKR